MHKGKYSHMESPERFGENQTQHPKDVVSNLVK